MFKKYMHVERLLSDEVDGLLIGAVQVQPKIDGANASIWCEADGYHYASRNQEATGGECFGLGAWVADHHETLYQLFDAHPTWRLYGEWLVPHTLKTYRPDAWRKFYVFDVFDDETNLFVPYTEYQPVLVDMGFDYIPIMATVTNPTEDVLRKMVDQNTFLIQDGAGVGEGLVLKRYDFVNKYGKTVWAKIVRNEFKEQNRVVFGVPDISCTSDEVKFAQEYVTRGRLDKALADLQPWNSKRIPELFGRVYYELITTELWDFLKSRKNRVKLEFNVLNQHIITQIKTVYPELF